MKRHLIKYIRILLLIAPGFVRRKVNKIAVRREYVSAMERMKRTKVSRIEIEHVMEQIDLDCDVMFHISTMNIGKLAGGTKFLADQIERKVDISKHTLLLSALPYRGSFRDYLKANPTFDVRTAPVAMGAVNEYFALKPEIRRSLHPTHSVVALGPQAEEYTKEHHLDDTPFGPHSPYYKLLVNGGKVVLFGATLNNLTITHVFEDMLGPLFPKKVYTSTYEVKVIDYQGHELTVTTPCHRAVSGVIRDGEILRKGLMESGAMLVWPIGEGEVSVIDLSKFARFYLGMILNGRSIYGRHKVNTALKDKINDLMLFFTTKNI